MDGLLADLELAVKAAYDAGEIARYYQENGFEQLEDKDATKGDPNLTEADLAIDRFLCVRLLEQTPGYGWLSEENSVDNYKGKDRVWIVDPIDGTKGFIKRDNMFTISIALVENGCPMIGVIYNPMRDQMFYGLKGHGVFFNGQRMYTQTPDMQDAFLISPMRRKDKPYTQKLMNETAQFEEVGSVAYRLGLIAAGQADLTFVDHEISLWDIAAGAAMLEEQGFDIRNLDGSDINFDPETHIVDNGIIVAKEYLFDKTQDCLRELLK